MRRLPIGLALLFSLQPVALSRAADTAPEAVRVGVVAFEDFERKYQKWEAVLSEFSRATEGELSFELATGTYGDLLHWMEKGWIDVGILTSGVFAESLRPGKAFGPFVGIRLCGHGGAAAGGVTLGLRRSAETRVIIISTARFAWSGQDSSRFESIDDVSRLAASGKVEFVLVHPLSVSGQKLPVFSLAKTGDHSGRRMPVHYSYSHSGSLRRLTEPDPDRERVAFVWDDALRDIATGNARSESPCRFQPWISSRVPS